MAGITVDGGDHMIGIVIHRIGELAAAEQAGLLSLNDPPLAVVGVVGDIAPFCRKLSNLSCVSQIYARR